MTDIERAKKTLGYLETYPTTIVIDGKEIPAVEVTAIYAGGRGLGENDREDARQRLAAGLRLDAEKVNDAALDAFLAFVDDKWLYPPPASIPPGKIRWIELEGFSSEDNPLGVHNDCANIFSIPNEEEETADDPAGEGNAD